MNNYFYLLLPVVFVITGCVQERYRYPCQDPHNWNEELCKKPFCSANGTCPEDLKHYEKEIQKKEIGNINKGVCK